MAKKYDIELSSFIWIQEEKHIVSVVSGKIKHLEKMKLSNVHS